MSRSLDLSGRTFGRLRVMSRATNDKVGHARWLCLCICGNNKTCKSQSLNEGVTRSCGCLHIETVRELAKKMHAANTNPDAAMRRLFSNYVAGAKNRNIAFGLSLEDFRELVTKDCFYCSSPPLFIVQTAHSRLAYNGVDRMDSSIGYTPGNCVTCCKPCNWMKKDMSVSEFERRASEIHSKTRRRQWETKQLASKQLL